MATSPLAVKLIDRKGQRFGAGLSAAVLALTASTGFVPLVALVALALAVSAAFGTRWFLFGRPYPTVRQVLRIAPGEREPEIPPRFAQALGALALGIAFVLLLVGQPAGWVFVIGVAGLQVVLAVTGYCLGCRLYGLHWILPSLFDRAVGVVRPIGRG